MNVDSVNRAVSNAANKVREAKAAPPPPAPAPAPAPATTSSKSQVQSAFEAAKAQPVNLTGQSAPTAQTAPASASSFRYVPGTTGLTTTSAGSTKAAVAATESVPGTSVSRTIEETQGFGVGFKYEASTSPVVIKPGGEGPEGKVKLQTTGSVYAYVEAEAERGELTVGGKAIQGARTTYEVELPQKDYEAWVSRGSNPADLPTPFFNAENPPPMGTTLQLKSEHYQSRELQVAYRNIQAQTGNTHAKGSSMSVERVGPESPPTVRITSGPTEAVQRTLGVGVGNEKVSVSLTGERGLESYNLQTAELNLATEEGMAAYKNFLLTGQVPQQKGPGVESAGREYKLSYTEALKAGLVVGEYEFSANLNNVEQEIKVTETDNTRKIEMGYFSTADEGMSSVRTQSYYRDDSGQWAPHPTGATQVAYSNLSPENAALLQEVFTGQPGDPKAGGSYNTQFTMSDSEALMLAQRARKYSKDRGLDNSEADVFIQQLSAARTPQEVQSAFNKARGNTASVEALWILYNHAADPMPLGSGYRQAKR